MTLLVPSEDPAVCAGWSGCQAGATWRTTSPGYTHPHLARCVVQVIAVGCEGVDRAGAQVDVRAGVVARKAALPNVATVPAARGALVSARVAGTGEPTPRRLLSLRLGGQPLTGSGGGGGGVLPGQVHHGVVRAFSAAAEPRPLRSSPTGALDRPPPRHLQNDTSADVLTGLSRRGAPSRVGEIAKIMQHNQSMWGQYRRWNWRLSRPTERIAHSNALRRATRTGKRIYSDHVTELCDAAESMAADHDPIKALIAWHALLDARVTVNWAGRRDGCGRGWRNPDVHGFDGAPVQEAGAGRRRWRR